jgi:hypothetical protein
MSNQNAIETLWVKSAHERKERKCLMKQRNRDCIGYVVNNKIENLTEEEHLKRKEYIKIKMRECRERKRQASQDE